MRVITFQVRLAVLLLLTALWGCGPEPAFRNLQEPDSSAGKNGGTGGSEDPGSKIGSDGTNPEDDGKNSIDANPENPNDDKIADNDNKGGGNNGGNNGGGNGGNPDGGITFPDIEKDSDKEEIKKCLAAWGNAPFAGPTSVRKIYASVVIGGIGFGVNDTVKTPNPELVIVYAGVNVGGQVTYNMLNPNAYYCMVSNVNVQTKLTVNLHCNARLGDSKIGIDIDSQKNGNTAAIGINVGSDVTIQNVRPNGEACIR